MGIITKYVLHRYETGKKKTKKESNCKKQCKIDRRKAVMYTGTKYCTFIVLDCVQEWITVL